MTEETPPLEDTTAEEPPSDDLGQVLGGDAPDLGDSPGSLDPESESQGILSKLQNTDPNPPVESVGELYNSNHYKRYLMRAVMKITGEEGEPAWFDLVRGVIGAGHEMQEEPEGTESPDIEAGEPVEDSEQVQI